MNMKKYLTVAALIGTIGFASISMVDARGYYGEGYGSCGATGIVTTGTIQTWMMKRFLPFLRKPKRSERKSS